MSGQKLPPLPNTPATQTQATPPTQVTEHLKVSPVPPLGEERKWSPLITKDEVKEAKDFGQSLGSKKVAQGPGYVNLRFMCYCLAKAIKKHLDFNPTNAHFLHDITTIVDNGPELGFTYDFKMKVTLNPSKPDKEQECGEEPC